MLPWGLDQMNFGMLGRTRGAAWGEAVMMGGGGSSSIKGGVVYKMGSHGLISHFQLPLTPPMFMFGIQGVVAVIYHSGQTEGAQKLVVKLRLFFLVGVGLFGLRSHGSNKIIYWCQGSSARVFHSIWGFKDLPCLYGNCGMICLYFLLWPINSNY